MKTIIIAFIIMLGITAICIAVEYFDYKREELYINRRIAEYSIKNQKRGK